MSKGNSSRRGDAAELVATAYLLENGYEIFNNASCVGPVDLVAMSPDGSLILVDVKRSTTSLEGINFAQKNRSRRSKDFHNMAEVKILYVFISEKFDIVVDFDEKSFYSKIEEKGFRVPGKNLFVSGAKYTVQSFDGQVFEVIGKTGLMELCNFTEAEAYKFLYNTKLLNGWTLLERETVRVKRQELLDDHSISHNRDRPTQQEAL